MKRREFLKSAGIAGLVAPALIPSSSSAAAADKSSETGLTITWLGSATMLMQCGELSLLTDPCFGDGDKAFKMGDPNEMFDLSKGPNVKYHKRLTPFPGIDIDGVDHLIVSHMHEDHFDQEAEKQLPRTLPVLAPSPDIAALNKKGFSKTSALDWGTETVVTKGDISVRITAIRADHSENQEIAKILGAGNGYWMEFERGDWKLSVYWSGDTFHTEPVLTALKPFGKPDVFIPHLGAVGTTGPLGKISMDAEDLAEFATALQPKKILPVHHSTYELYLEPGYKLAEAMENTSFGLDLISEGTPVIYA